jgi:hypothetical protein
MNTCKEMPYEEVNTLQVSAASFRLSHTVVLIISLEFQRPPWKELLYEWGLF